MKQRSDTCAKCGGLVDESRRGRYAYCKACHAAANKRFRKKESVTRKAMREQIFELKQEVYSLTEQIKDLLKQLNQ